MRDIEIFRDPNHAHNFNAGLFLSIPLDEDATQLIIEHLRPKNQKAVYVILTFEGKPSPNRPIETQWERVLRRAVEEEVVVYNSSRRHGSRAVWAMPPEDRTETNFFWEKVKLYPMQHVVTKLKVDPRVVLVRNRDGG